MNNLNSILIEGNLVKDPLLRTTSKGTQVCSMTLASNRFYKMDSGFEKEVSYFDVDTWSKLAEVCYAKGKKGRGVRVVGRLKQSRWNDPDGKTHSRINIVAEHVEFRPEFRKDAKSASEVPLDDEYEGEENGEPVMAMAGRELEAVAF
ncbi:MAG: single-stranded DNA-binding protein [Treponema sp.]|nr:single-stranded DNA-binding protein [Treponema sp.]